MTAEIVNLRRYRKAKERSAKAAEAEASRLRHGRTKSERITSEAERERERRRLDGARRTDDIDPASVLRAENTDAPPLDGLDFADRPQAAPYLPNLQSAEAAPDDDGLDPGNVS